MPRAVSAAAALTAAALCLTCAPARADEKGEGQANLTPTPAMQAVLDALTKMPGKPLTDCTPAEARKQPSAADAVAYVMKEKGIDPNQNPMEYEKDIEIPGPAGDIPVRVYYPGSPTGQPLPVIVYYHGGGFVIATNDTYESSARGLAKGAGAILFSVEYRKAPEHKYPAAYDDAVAAYKWATMHASDYKGDNSKVAVAGESAGGNLAAGVSQAARDGKFQLPVAQLLVYPWVKNDATSKSAMLNANAKPLATGALMWFTKQYLTEGGSLKDPKVFPAYAADLSGLPPAMVVTASIDPLHSEGEDYAKALAMAGTPTHYMNYGGVTHEFFGMGAVVPDAANAMNDATAALKTAFMGQFEANIGKDGKVEKMGAGTMGKPGM